MGVNTQCTLMLAQVQIKVTAKLSKNNIIVTHRWGEIRPQLGGIRIFVGMDSSFLPPNFRNFLKFGQRGGL